MNEYVVMFGAAFVVIFVFTMVTYLLIASWFPPVRWFFCRVLPWHSIITGFIHTGHDGCSAHAKCKWCGYEGMIDSQGNLF